jgi:hypothetical protein
MNYYYVEPEVAGGLGGDTIMDRSKHPPVVSYLHYEFDGWLGDALLERFPCFIITQAGRSKLESAAVTGVKFEPVKVSTSEEWRDFYPSKELPSFAWMQVGGNPGRDDFGVGEKFRLVVSDRALRLLRELGIAHAKITEI